MTSHSFIDSLSYLYLTSLPFQNVCNAAGISWSSLPNLESVQIVRKYIDLRKTTPHEVVLFGLADDLRFLDMCALDLTQLSNDPRVLAWKFGQVMNILEMRELGERLQKYPERGDEFLRSFRQREGTSVEYAFADQFVKHSFAKLMEKIEGGESIKTIPCFEYLSKAIGGFNPGRLIMLMAETGFGKTNLGLNLALCAAEKDTVLYANMEMVYDDIANRIAVIKTAGTFSDLYSGRIQKEQLDSELDSIKQRLFMTNGKGLSVPAIESWIRLMSEQHQPKFVIIDYDQKLELHHDKSVPEWKTIQYAIIQLEELAKELNFCCIVMAQVNREGAISSSHRATFTAHTVLDFREDDVHGPVIHAKKNRHGPRNAAVRVKYTTENARIRELESIVIGKQIQSAVKTLKRGPWTGSADS